MNNKNKEVLSKIENILNDTIQQKNSLPNVNEIVDLLSDFYSERQLLSTFYTSDLIYYLEDTWEFDDYISDIKTEVLNDYVRYHPEYTKENFMKEIQNYNKYDFKNFLCDLTYNGYHIETDKLLNDIKKIIE